MDTETRLDLGCGREPLPGFTGIDAIYGGSVYPLDGYADNSVAEIHASHILEHFSHRVTLDVLREWVRVLKPGGRLRVAVPDFARVVEQYQSGEPSDVIAHLMGGQHDEQDVHRALFDKDELAEAMLKSGLCDIRGWTSDRNDCASLPVSLNLEGFKRRPIEVKGVHAIMSMPRLAFTDNFLCAMRALTPLGIPLSISRGVFWGQCMTKLIDDARKTNARYLLTIDYDSLYRTADVSDLYRLMEDNPEAGAICATQVGRDRDTVLLTLRGKDGSNRKGISADELASDLLRIATGHFGLTMIRMDAIDKLPRPLFWSKPDDKGDWGDDRTDEDIWFWRQMDAAGIPIYQANRVVIGHIQRVVTWPTHNLEPLHQYLPDYEREGIPRKVAR